MANVFAKSGRKQSVFYVGKILLGEDLVDIGLTNAEFKANKVLVDALDKGVIALGLPDDKPADDVPADDVPADDKPELDDQDNDGLPDDKEALVEIADSYGLEYNPQLGAKKLKALIAKHIESGE